MDESEYESMDTDTIWSKYLKSSFDGRIAVVANSGEIDVSAFVQETFGHCLNTLTTFSAAHIAISQFSSVTIGVPIPILRKDIHYGHSITVDRIMARILDPLR